MIGFSKFMLAAGAAVLMMSGPAAAQNAQPPGAAQPRVQAPQPTAEETAELRRVVNRGRELFEIDRAARLTTRELLTRVPDPAAAGIVGWIAEREGNGLTVSYYAQTDAGPVTVFRGQVINGRVAARDTFTGANRPAFSAAQRRLVAARAAVEALGNTACGTAPFNIFVIPPTAAGGAIEVYQFSAQTAAGQIPAGGHFRTAVAADGTAGTPQPLVGACRSIEVPQAPAAGQRPRPMQVRHETAPLPNEAHVLMSYWAGRPLFVASGTPERLWGIAGDEIRLVGIRRDAATPATRTKPAPTPALTRRGGRR